MYNQDLPRRAELPTSRELRRSTFIAAIVAAALLVTTVLPAEYGIDPTGVGRVFGLTEMGEIKMQLAREAELDAAATASAPDAAVPAAAPPQEQPVETADAAAERQALEQRVTELEDLIARLEAERTEAAPPAEAAPEVEPAPEAEVAAAPAAEPEPAETGQSDEISITLQPGQGAEVKLVMEAGARASYRWSTDRGVVNCDLHGDGGGQSVTYEKVRGEPAYEGVIEAAFTGNHGWFWRNRTDAPLTVTLRASGDYAEMKRLI